MKNLSFYNLLVSGPKRETLTFDSRATAVKWLQRFFPNLTIHEDPEPGTDGWLSVWSQNIVPADPDATPFVYGMGISMKVHEEGDF